MPLLKNGQPITDIWQPVADADALPADGAVIISFARWRKERATLLGRNSPLGVRLANTDKVEEVAPDLERFEIVVLEFPKFVDGRAYSQARLLRDRYGYRGELRATGNVLRDELQFMQRCGIDAFEIADSRAVESWRAAVNEFSVFYQPAADGHRTVSELRRAAAR